MFDKFIEFFDVYIEVEYDNNFDALCNLRNMLGGQSVNDGVFRVLKQDEVEEWKDKIVEAFPKFVNKFEPFAFDWLGRFFAVKIQEDDEPGIFMFDLSLNRCVLIPENLVDFLNEELTTHANVSLDIECFYDWRTTNPPIAYEDCVGYIIPMFDGGVDDVTNVQLTSMKEYWEVFTELIKTAPYSDRLLDHYEYFFDVDYTGIKLDLDIMSELNDEFCVLKFKPTEQRDVWIYATHCMSCTEDFAPVELYMYSQTEHDEIAEILTNIAYYHKTTSNLESTHVIEFGKPWNKGSNCDYGLVCPPYIDGPEFEECGNISCYWLLPITKQESDYRIEFGMEALEEKFGNDEFDFLDCARDSVV